MEAKKTQVADIVSKGLEKEDITSENLRQISEEIDNSASEEKEKSQEEIELEGLSFEELIESLEELLEKPVEEIRQKVELIRNLYYRKREEYLEMLKRQFIEDGGEENDFKTPMDILDLDGKFQRLWNKYKEKREKYEEAQRKIREQNYQEKLSILEKVKKLPTSKKDFDQAYKEFKQLERKWKEIGQVPKEVYRELMNQWNQARKEFYDWVKINEEFRQIDFKRNYDAKVALIQRAEALIYEPDPVKAYRELQALHREWKEIGPVAKEYREKLWESFRALSQQINKRHQEYFKTLKERQRKNLEAKTRLCEVAEKIAVLELSTVKEWQEKTKIILELQQLWRKVGRVPKKYNQEIYERFRKACDQFFERKREFFRQHQEILLENLKKKEELAQKAEELKESTEWGKTARAFEQLFEQWKKIGPVPREKSEEVWQRFRTARLEFFRRKRQHLKELRRQERENLEKKLALIEKIKNLQLSDNQEENMKLLNDIEKEWNSIGFVPFKEKDKILDLYRKTLEEKFAQVNLDEENRRRLMFEQRLKNILESNKAKKLLAREIDRYRNSLDKLKTEVLKLENNLEMFKDSPEELLKDFRDRIAKLKEDIKTYEEYISRMINEYKKLN